MSKKPNHHYFATTVFGWAVAETRKAAIEGVANEHKDYIKQVISSCGSCYAWSCKVHLPIDAPYGIEYYRPVGVRMSSSRNHAITKLTKEEVRHLVVDVGAKDD